MHPFDASITIVAGNAGPHRLVFLVVDSSYSEHLVLWVVSKLPQGQATGHCDWIPAKLLKCMFTHFPSYFKHKLQSIRWRHLSKYLTEDRGDRCISKINSKLNKSNHKPVKILTVLAKVFFRKFLPTRSFPFLTLSSLLPVSLELTLIENWQKNHKIGVTWMDLGVQDQSIKIIKSYLSDRQQFVWIGNVHSSWKTTSENVHKV